MATTGIMPGTIYAMYMGGTKIGLLTSNSYNLTRGERAVANKDSGDWEEYKLGRMGWRFTAEFMIGVTTNVDIADLLAALIAGTPVALVMGTTEGGDPQVSGNGLLKNIQVDARDNDNVTGSCEFVGTGALTPGTVA